MDKSQLQTKIGPYEVIKSLGKGGMGEVFLVYDPLCQRKIALKKILPDLASHSVIRERFLREAKFAASLSHPCIIPIFQIEESEDAFYTMAYIEGETLKEIFKSTLLKEKKGLTPHEIGDSIPALTRVFLSICQAIAYAYSKGFLHRDLKPENIMVGKYGEVFLLDWGIATHVDGEEEEDLTSFEVKEVDQNLTRPGKVLGTVNFMSPERALKNPANIQSEIYSLGVILYQILTLKLPFARKDLKHFRKILRFENLEAPEDVAPYRDIPKQLSLIAQKCLSTDVKERYQNIHDLIFDLQNYIEGKPEWILLSKLSMMRKEDWEFQENILLSPQMAISNLLDSLVWMGLMISKKPVAGNLKIEFEVLLPQSHEGLGVLLMVPDPLDRKGLEDGYCLWLSSFAENQMNLFRAGAEIASTCDHGIKPYEKSTLCIEKIGHSLLVYVDGVLKIHYISHLPIVGNHIGILYKNPDFHLSELSLSTGSHAVMINCLSIPDAFFSSKNFDQAYIEYKKIAKSFEGRTEGRQAQLRAGLSLIEKGKREKNKLTKDEIFNEAFAEFELLKNTTGAPLEYLGKSLIYYHLEDPEEEIKCLELALRKYPLHPLLSVLKEQIIFRLHETSKQSRASAYQFLLLCVRNLPEIFAIASHSKLLENLLSYWILPFFIEKRKNWNEEKRYYHFISIVLAFWLNKPLILIEIGKEIQVHSEEDLELILDLFFSLLYLEKLDLAQEVFEHRIKGYLKEKHHQVILELVCQNSFSLKDFLLEQNLQIDTFYIRLFDYLSDEIAIESCRLPLISLMQTIPQPLLIDHQRLAFKLLKIALLLEEETLFLQLYKKLPEDFIKLSPSLTLLHQLNEMKSESKHELFFIEKSKEEVFYFEKLENLKKLYLYHKINHHKEKAIETLKKIKHLKDSNKNRT